MAVYTEVSQDEAGDFVARLDIGRLTRLQPIRAGIENTNYFVSTHRGEWVLTLFERLQASELPFYLGLMRHLARKGIPVPEPRADGKGDVLHELCGKPAALVNKLSGHHQLAPDHHHCEQLGDMLARLHLAGQDFAPAQAHSRGPDWWVTTVPEVLPFVSADHGTLLTGELAFLLDLVHGPAYADLPTGPIHADLFRDNALFEGLPGREKLTGLFDFYFAGVDAWLLDLAICLNDWCIDLDSGRGDDARAAHLVAAYAAVRPLTGGERRLLPAVLRAAAFRFWLSRLWDLHLPRDAQLLTAHDPAHFERVLRHRIDTPWHPPA